MYCMHTMSAEQENKGQKPRMNLSLSAETIAQGEVLQRALCRPSFTNLVEALIDAEHKRLFPSQTLQPEVKEAA